MGEGEVHKVQAMGEQKGYFENMAMLRELASLSVHAFGERRKL